MKSDFDPRNLNVLAFAQASGTFHAQERVAHFDRLLEETQGLGAEFLLHFSATGSLRPDPAGVDEVWIHLKAEVVLPLTCQRCMGPVDVSLNFARDFRFVASEELAAVEDENSEEDVLVLSRNFDVAALVEDELLMGLPVSPKHETCPENVKFHVADPDFVEESLVKPNPFAVLEQLKKK